MIFSPPTCEFTGPLCNQPLNCKCAPNVECLDQDKCGPCPPGHTGDGFHCERSRPCDQDPCHPGLFPSISKEESSYVLQYCSEKIMTKY